MPGQDRSRRRLARVEPGRAGRCSREGSLVHVLADGHRPDHRRRRTAPSRTDLRPGIPARGFCAEDYRWFSEICSRIGISRRDTAAQWNLLVKITAITGVAPRALNDTCFDTARAELTAAYTRRGRPSAGKNVAAVLHRLRLTLFHAGRLALLRPPAVKPPVSVTGWATVAPEFAATARRYVEQVT